MKITDIKAQRRKGRFSIFVDTKYSFSLSELQLVDAGLHVGDELKPDDIERLTDDSEFGKLLDKVYNFVSYRERSRKEVVDYMRRNHYGDAHIEQVLLKLESQNFIDDQRFAASWVESRQLLSPRSQVQLRAELRQKGIESNIIDEVLTQTTSGDESQVVVDLIRQRHLASHYDNERKLIRYLTGKGFRYDSIKAALEQLKS